MMSDQAARALDQAAVEEIAFTSRGVRLAGSLHWPAGARPCPALVVLHAANGGTRRFPFYQHLAKRLPALGVAVLLYDRRGEGGSEGQAPALFSTLVEDGAAAVDWLCSRAGIDAGRIGLYGISQGGWLAPETAVLRPQVCCLAIVSGCGISPVRQVDYAAAYTLRQSGFSEAQVERALALRQRLHACYRGQLPRQLVAAELEQAQNEAWFEPAHLDGPGELPEQPAADPWAQTLDYDPLPAWGKLRQPALFLFAEQDRWVPVADSAAAFRSATRQLADVSLAQIPGTDHMMAEIAGPDAGRISQRYLEALEGWLRRQLRLTR